LIPAYYINLERSEGRRIHTEKMAASAGISIERIEAVDGQMLSDMQLKKVCSSNTSERSMTKSEIACFLSHRKVWSLISRGVSPYGAIFEEDIYMSRYLTPLLVDSKWIKPNMDFIKLDKATKKKVKLGPPEVMINDMKVCKLLSQHMGCGGYIISKKCATDLLKKTERFDRPVDITIFHTDRSLSTHLTLWQVNPAVCTHNQFQVLQFLPNGAEKSTLDIDRVSSIQNHRKSQNTKLIYKILRELKRPFVQIFSWLSRLITGLFSEEKWEDIEFRE
jgi:glycosyl transferase family 25